MIYIKTAAIIAEFNPFHNGHKYLIDYIKEHTDADFIICIMSGDFVQRGDAAVFDKYTRASMALYCGIDAVFELPLIYSLGSAEYFALGAINILNSMNSIDYLVFGCENPDISLLDKISEVLVNEPDEYRNYLNSYLKSGLSYPLSRSNALIEYCNLNDNEKDIIKSPNNILAIEYLKALKLTNSNITPVPVLRIGAGYHDTTEDKNTNTVSATFLRDMLYSCADFYNYIPESIADIYKNALNTYKTVNIDDFSDIFYYLLLSKSYDDLMEIADIDDNIANKLINYKYDFFNISSFIEKIKTREYTYSRLSRCIMHIILDIKKDYYNKDLLLSSKSYTRLLGFRKDSSSVIKEIKKDNDNIIIITKPSSIYDYKDTCFYNSMKADMFAHDLYISIPKKNSKDIPCQLKQSPVMV